MTSQYSESRFIVISTILSLLLGFFFAGALPASGATMSVSATAPTVDGADIAQLTGGSDPGGNLGHLWSNRPVHGQTFRPTAASTLYAVTLSTRGAGNTGQNYNIRVGTVSGSTFTQVAAETATSVAIAAWDYVTITFATPIALTANTLYAFDMGCTGSGFISDANAGDVLADSQAYSSGANGVGSGTMTLHSLDRVFHVDM
ncbi:MAG: hypothetical protein QGH15_17035, partial [Kiritimatiellia bacterium]|nr:hypothetical protein [Kiritimatiellia bacterium]